MSNSENQAADLANRFAILALRNLVVYPGISVPIRVGRQQSLEALKSAREQALPAGKPAKVIAVLQSAHEIDHTSSVKESDLYRVGTLCEIERIKGSESDGVQLLIKGLERVTLEDFQMEKSSLPGVDFISAQVKRETDKKYDQAKDQAAMAELKESAMRLVHLLPSSSGAEQLTKLLDGITDLDFLTYIAAANLEVSIDEKQALLAEPDRNVRAEKITSIMNRVHSELQVKGEIREKLNTKLGKTQRDAILREQMKAIREELGDEASDSERAEDYRLKIENSRMPDEVRKVAIDELKRLEGLSNQSPETHIIRNYLDLLIALPWEAEATDVIDLKKARASLEADHEGLEKVKKRIIEHLATMKLRGGERGMILLLVGPPGVGKTSLGASIAKAIGRKFVRAALGGVRDDAEIRGHRRTYVGAMPGRVIQGIKRAGAMNPVFVLDEIDKLARGYSGDPAAALLEVLDPEQNSKFHDHYLDVPYDLSKVLFIATANSLDGIPGPLLDRMEVLDLSGYTSQEKMGIARKHLLPKQLAEHGLTEEQVAIEDEVLKAIINGYTREAGVRTLQRQIASLLRSLATSVVDATEAEAEKLPIKPAVTDLDELIGPKRFDHEETLQMAPAGVVTGLAWTPVGGEILFVEASSMPGSGRLTLTGQLGDVMKESAQIALTLIRSRLPEVAERIDFEKRDFHVHVPAGAIPKDGPSAGVAMVTALTSLMTGKSVNPQIAMTGEITLRGQVTPVGGVKEKIIGAHRAGIKTVILPRKNEKDLRDVPDEIKKSMQIEFADDLADVLRISLGLKLPPLDQVTGLWGTFSASSNRSSTTPYLG
ncbi:MAG: endopeptidase La [Deltaproteobacteria bacterium]|jgi:ATP-dependent Lon protease|nr:endopeptidase La [Deltaproteobacteria bacterium]